MSLDTPIRDIVNLDEVFGNFGITFQGKKIVYEGDSHSGLNENLVKVMRQGRTTVADFLGKREHDIPVIDESYIQDVSVEDMVAGLIRLGVGYPWSNPDYAILPVLYAINARAIPVSKEGYVLHEGLFKPRNLVSIDSCVGHARVITATEHEEEVHSAVYGPGHEHSDPGYEPSGSSGYAVMPKLATHCEGFITLGRRLNDETRIVERAIADLEREFRRHDALETITRVSHDRETLTVRSKAWERLSPRYPMRAEKSEIAAAANPIMTAVYKTWTAIILAVNEVNHGNLAIDTNLVHVIKEYSLNSRYNALMTTNHLENHGHGGHQGHGGHH